MLRQHQIADRIKQANRISLTQDYLREAMRGGEKAHLPSDFSTQHPVSPWVEGALTFVGVASFIGVLWLCWVVFSKTQGGV